MNYPIFLKTGLMVLSISLVSLSTVFASDDPSSPGIFDVLSYREVVNIDLEFDLDAVVTDRRSDEEHAAELRFKDADGNRQEWAIKISVRGKFRRSKCSEMPPLKINFKKKDLEAAGLAPFDDFKLVTYCVGDDLTAAELLLKEYLAYKLYNELTDASFRVQLLNITYKDTQTGLRKKQMGFLIEDTAQLRARLDAEKSKEDRVIERERYHPEFSKMAALFEYLIGNADYGLTYSKNIKYIVREELLVPVPYDFDFSALVGANYATFVPSRYGQSSINDRIYLGFEKSREELASVLALFEEKQGALYEVIRKFKLLKTTTRTEMLDYLDSFYKNTDDLTFWDPDAATTDTE